MDNPKNNSRFSEMTYYISLASNVLAIQSFHLKKFRKTIGKYLHYCCFYVSIG